MKKVILAIVGILIVSVAIFITFQKSPDSVKNSKPDYVVEPAALADEFVDDENNANLKYLDKTIQLEGVVLEVQENSDNKTTIYLEGNIMNKISCLFSNDELKDAKIEVGQKVLVKGKCSGFILDVVLIKCTLIE